ncbi:MAG: site-2 protease family protein [Nitrososphaerota archaeon]|nr:site-2 protease family protein [Aigarchaeota archaeon]MDW8076962.1 site-2 protease family protein [Nitrososphaerota archaeon]
MSEFEYSIDDLENIKALVAKRFTVEDVFFEEGVLSFVIREYTIKEPFKELVFDLRKIGYVPMAVRDGNNVLIKVFPYKRVAEKTSRMPLILFFATVGTVLIDGYLRSASYADVFSKVFGRFNVTDVLLNTLLFAVALMSIIGLHEFGHLLSAKASGIGATPPYFIPGVPGLIPTFGALIFQKDPAINKDSLFDSGISGPITGFVVSVFVMVAAFLTANWLSTSEYETVQTLITKEGGVFLPSPLVFYLIRPIFGKPDMVPFFSTLGFAAWLGMVVTAINLFPAWQLDGGRIFRPLLSRKQYIIASYASALLLIITGYFLLGILILLMSSRTPDIVPLDQVSPLSKKRKLAILGVIGILVLSFVPLSF